MKIVVFGPDKRTGVLHDGNVVDLSYACAKRLREQEGEPGPLEMSEALVPSDLARLIEGGPRARSNMRKRRSITFSGRRTTNSDREAKRSSTRPRMCGCTPPGRIMFASPAPAETSPTMLRQLP